MNKVDYNGGLGGTAEPQAGSKGRAHSLVRGQGEAPEPESLLFIFIQHRSEKLRI